jgi:hypothetical protein
MQALADISTALTALRGYDTTGLPLSVRERIINASFSLSPVVSICETGEALYAATAYLDNPGRVLCAQLISFAAENGWHGLASPRGMGITRAMLRDAGEEAPSGKWPKPSEDPEPDMVLLTGA